MPTVAACLDLVVHLGIDADGQRRVREIVGVPGRVENDVIEIEPIFEQSGGRLARARGVPPRADRFEHAGFDLQRLLGAS